MSFESKIESDIDISLLLGPEDPWQLILLNDDVTTFDHVVNTLVRFLDIPTGRAEHFAMEAHTTGRSIVKDGTKEAMLSLAEKILNAHIGVSVEKPA